MTSAIAGVGKKKAWEVLQRSEAHQESLGMVGLSPTLKDACRVKCEFVDLTFPLWIFTILYDSSFQNDNLVFID